MKKHVITALLALAPLALALTACSDDNDLPQVDFSISYSNCVEQDGTLYAVAGETFSIDAVNVRPVSGTKQATLGTVAYYWNYLYLGTTAEAPFAMAVDTQGQEPGKYLLQLTMTVFQVDKSIGQAAIAYPVQLVATPEELPTPDTSGTDTPEATIAPSAGQ